MLHGDKDDEQSRIQQKSSEKMRREAMGGLRLEDKLCENSGRTKPKKKEKKRKTEAHKQLFFRTDGNTSSSTGVTGRKQKRVITVQRWKQKRRKERKGLTMTSDLYNMSGNMMADRRRKHRVMFLCSSH